MGDLQRNLTEELAEARERVSAVKKEFKQKVGELQKEHEEWRHIIENHQQHIKEWQDKYDESQAQVRQLRQQMQLNEQLQADLSE
ncbi:hypothetical protein EMWEY_00011960 [Eimeria maxima]|uniref:Uncharacterized protein n=1 Tax=Eimeria maxima TaxID=5804 RepID=U6M845_EIMMA|nr:hypothetical protein EMWEY_00011960 [Eimeria maxima]CDJ57845.1 hypothetical protein EMWEY_00011960 [Eimeria maxima]